MRRRGIRGKKIKVSMAVGQKERKRETNESLMSGCRENNGYLSNLVPSLLKPVWKPLKNLKTELSGIDSRSLTSTPGERSTSPQSIHSGHRSQDLKQHGTHPQMSE